MTSELDHFFHPKLVSKLSGTVRASIVDHDDVDRRDARKRLRDRLDYRAKTLHLVEARYLDHEFHRLDSLLFAARTTIHGNATRLVMRTNSRSSNRRKVRRLHR